MTVCLTREFRLAGRRMSVLLWTNEKLRDETARHEIDELAARLLALRR
jgi:hypothetical protein